MVAVLAMILWMIWRAWTFFKSVRAFFDMGRFGTALLTLWLGIAFMFASRLYQQVLFLVTLLGLRDLTVPAAG